MATVLVSAVLTGLSPASLQVPLQANHADSNIRVPLISNQYDRGLVPGVLADLHLQVVTASCVPSLERKTRLLLRSHHEQFQIP